MLARFGFAAVSADDRRRIAARASPTAAGASSWTSPSRRTRRSSRSTARRARASRSPCRRWPACWRRTRGWVRIAHRSLFDSRARHRRAGARAPHRLPVPALRAVSASHGARERRVRADLVAQAAGRGGRVACRRFARELRPAGHGRGAAGQALGRPAAARRARARAGLQSRRAAARRAVRGAESAAAPVAARGARPGARAVADSRS